MKIIENPITPQLNLKLSSPLNIYLNPVSNQKGQGLVEYLIIVALIAVAGIAVTKVLGQNIRVQYARISKSIQGVDASGIEADSIDESHYKAKDLSNFFNGSSDKDGRSDR